MIVFTEEGFKRADTIKLRKCESERVYSVMQLNENYLMNHSEMKWYHHFWELEFAVHLDSEEVRFNERSWLADG